MLRGIARIFQRGGHHTVSHPGYLPGCHVHVHAVFPKNDIFRMSSERGWGGGGGEDKLCP